jgi:hypothetical protein
MRLCPARRALARLATAAAFAVAVSAAIARADAAKPAAPAAGRSDDFRVQLLLAEQIDRFNPGVAASRSSVAAGGLATGLEFEFHAADFWMPKPSQARPQLLLGGRALSSERVLAQSVATAVDTLTGEAPDSVEVFPDAKSVELIGSLRIRYPLASMHGVPQTAIYLRAESGAVFAEHMTGDLLSMTHFGLGFERTAGTFEGSLVEVTLGSNESFGSRFSSGRYTVHVLLQGVMPPPEGSKRTRSNLSGFAELEVDTDNQGGPDGVRALLGLKLDGAGLFDGARGLLGL